MVKAELAPAALHDPKLYLNRELSLLEFQRRVFDEARDPANPLLERVKFLSILSSNLDEFFMVRFAGLKQQVAGGVVELSIDGRTPSAVVEAVRAEVAGLSDEIYNFWRDELSPALAAAGLRVLHYRELTKKQRASLDNYFLNTVFPVLTPLAFDPGRPFPHISNLSLNLAVRVKDRKGRHFARVKVPDTLPQLVPLPATSGPAGAKDECFVWMEDVIEANLANLFPGLEILDSYPFHVTRDAEYAIKEIESDDLLETIEEAVWRRRFRALVRLQVNRSMPEDLLEILTSNLELDAKDVFRVNGPLDLGRLKELMNLDRADLKDKPFVPFTPKVFNEDDLFAAVRKQDILLHHPFDSFQPVVEFLSRAAADPDVLAMKMTLYRTGRNSPIVAALLDGAVEYGKQVAVVVELKARFDEESNIEWARALEREGVHVIYGLVGLKVHSKIALIVRREGDTIHRYVHVATGNYNAVTARFYTDLGFLTADDQIGADATDLFNYLTGYSAKTEFRKLLVAPLNLRKRLEQLIAREVERHQKHGDGHLIFKMNALEDQPMIELLYRASQAGVKIDLLVRGLCCLRPGLPGVSETITVTSIVGRFLEHSRVYYFHNGGKEEVFLGSADLMPRNLSRRVEVVFPVEDAKLIRRVKDEILATYMADNVKARRMQSDGSYVRLQPEDAAKAVDSQAALIALRAR